MSILTYPRILMVLIPVAGFFSPVSKADHVRSVIVTEVVGYTASGDSLVFRDGPRELYLYAHGEEGERAVRLVRRSFESQSSICLHLNAGISGLVDRITASC